MRVQTHRTHTQSPHIHTVHSKKRTTLQHVRTHEVANQPTNLDYWLIFDVNLICAVVTVSSKWLQLAFV